MAKGQMRSNREKKKPKADAKKTIQAGAPRSDNAGSQVISSVKGNPRGKGR